LVNLSGQKANLLFFYRNAADSQFAPYTVKIPVENLMARLHLFQFQTAKNGNFAG